MPEIYAEGTHGGEANWVQTLPGMGWNMLLRLYGALEAWLNKAGQLRQFFDKVSFPVFLMGYTGTNLLPPLAAKS